MDKVKEYLLREMVLDENGEQRKTIFNIPLYKTLKSAKIAKEVNGSAGYVQPNGQDAFLMGNTVIAFFSNEEREEKIKAHNDKFG